MSILGVTFALDADVKQLITEDESNRVTRVVLSDSSKLQADHAVMLGLVVLNRITRWQIPYLYHGYMQCAHHHLTPVKH